MLKTITTASLLACTSMATLAHDGHGLPGSSHWHAGDVMLWLAGVAVAALLFFGDRRR